MIRRSLLAVLVLAAFVVAGCGSPSDPMTDADVQAFAGFSTAYQPLATEMLALSQAVAEKRVPAARASLDKLDPELDGVDAKVKAVGNRTVRLILQDYMKITRRAIASIGALVTHLKATPDKDPSRDLLAEIKAANDALAEADGNLVDRVLDQAANDQQKAAIEKAITIQG